MVEQEVIWTCEKCGRLFLKETDIPSINIHESENKQYLCVGDVVPVVYYRKDEIIEELTSIIDYFVKGHNSRANMILKLIELRIRFVGSLAPESKKIGITSEKSGGSQQPCTRSVNGKSVSLGLETVPKKTAGDISYCRNCNCVTHTKAGYVCGKCGEYKENEKEEKVK
jgi:hypothetical protein